LTSLFFFSYSRHFTHIYFPTHAIKKFKKTNTNPYFSAEDKDRLFVDKRCLPNLKTSLLVIASALVIVLIHRGRAEGSGSLVLLDGRGCPSAEGSEIGE